ncbi:MAG TPA: DUF434 domain-containing protein [Blastocatellia bacterium]|nr:DUF434 domain-containing protein [Blastocatellia bacterium]
MSPDGRQHRGPHPADAELFEGGRLPTLREATSELSWLLSRGYAMKSSLKIVGDRHGLTDRQRLAISRAACSDEQKERRENARLAFESARGDALIIDGFNLIITIEAALGGGVLMVCRDGCMRDLSSVHGSYRSVQETEAAICLAGELLQGANVESAKWLLDKPVSNSGRLARRIGEIASARRWPWAVEVVANPDRAIIGSDSIAVTSDSIILDGVSRWINLASHLVSGRLPQAWEIDLSF